MFSHIKLKHPNAKRTKDTGKFIIRHILCVSPERDASVSDDDVQAAFQRRAQHGRKERFVRGGLWTGQLKSFELGVGKVRSEWFEQGVDLGLGGGTISERNVRSSFESKDEEFRKIHNWGIYVEAGWPVAISLTIASPIPRLPPSNEEQGSMV